MLGILERLHAKNAVRAKVITAAQSAWQTEDLNSEQRLKELSPQYEKITADENQQFRDEELPLFKQMVELFTVKMHLSEQSTHIHYPVLVEFVELWERDLRHSLPRAVVVQLGAVDGSKLLPLYADLETHFKRLQTVLKK